MKHYNINVSGRVQGVGYRYAALKAAQSLGIKGFVRNEPDGSVYVEAEGEEENLGHFLRWCEKGSGFGRVDRVTKVESRLQGFREFRIKT